MPTPLNALVSELQPMGRVEQFDSEGGGRIVRIFYCQPYSAHKRVAAALKGTVYPDPVNAGKWLRALPHADPLYPWFYCTDVQVEPMHTAAASSSPNMKFDTGAPQDHPAPGQFNAIQTALSVLDEYDGDLQIDNLTPTEIVNGAIAYAVGGNSQATNTGDVIPINDYTSRGLCGAKITATYTPLLFQPGLTTDQLNNYRFDYVDPQWEPLTITTQLGRQLYFFSPLSGVDTNNPSLHSGLVDTYALPEVVWRFSIRRLMVPFIPMYTINMYSNKLNSADMAIGNLTFPAGTLRMETPEVITRRGPDGNLWFDIQYKFLARRLYDQYYQPGPTLPFDGNFVKGWVGWNWAYGIPNSNVLGDNIGNSRSSYYPVVWNGGAFQTFGTNHPLFLADTDVDLTRIPNNTGLGQTMNQAPFQAGFYAQQ